MMFFLNRKKFNVKPKGVDKEQKKKKKYKKLKK
jgi:hypothetical protein